MKTIITAAAVLFAANLSVAGFYHGLDEGNTDLSTPRLSSADVVGVQPSIGDSVERYQGWEDGNPDLFKADSSASTASSEDPDIYMGLGGNPDLQF